MPVQESNKTQLSRLIKEKALQMGFAACGIAKAEAVSENHQLRFSSWLEKEYHGRMQYMTNHRSKRMDPGLLLEGARSVICLAYNYHQKNFQHPDSHYKVSQYAAGKDYHYVIKEKLTQLTDYINSQAEMNNYRIFVDSAPVLERYWAQQSGLGWIGKNACLIIPKKGSYFFLSEIILDIELDYDYPEKTNYCGSCTLCLDACPTQAITAPGEIDARRCISYFTIELKDKTPEEFYDQMNQYIFGCDICQDVCPHNVKFATPTAEEKFNPLPALSQWKNQDWESIDKSDYRRNFVKASSPISRASFEKLKDSIRIAGLSLQAD